jgi:multidrug efflux pump subunit AcrA (membrane-fusion protein)
MAQTSPRFRRDLEASGVEADGVQYVEVRDASTGKTFRFYDFEHAAALALDGRPLEVVAAALRDQSGLELSSDQLAAFADQLHELGFLEPSPAATEASSPVASQAEVPASTQPKRDSVPLIFGGEPAPAAPAFGLDSLGEDETKLASPGRMSSLLEELRTSDASAAPPSAPEARPLTPPPDLPAVAARPTTPPPMPAEARGQTPRPVPTSDPGPSSVASSVASSPLAASPAPAASVAPTASSPAAAPAALALDADGTDFEWPPAPATPARPAEPATETVSEFPPRVAPLAPAPPSPGPPSPGPPSPEGDRVTAPLRPSSLEALAAEMNAVPSAQMSAVPSAPPVGALDASEEPTVGSPTSLPVPPKAPTTPGPVEAPASIVPAPAVPRRGRSWALVAALAVAAAGGVAALFWERLVGGEPPPLAVRTIVPSPASVYRWFEVTAQVKAAPSTAASLPAGGKVAEILPAGSKVAAGDVIVTLDIAKRARGEVAHNKERLAYYQQMLESMRAAGNRGEVRQAELKIEEKQKLLEAAQAELEKVAVVAKGPGVVAEALVAVGAQIKAGEPLVRMKGGAPSATFALGKELAAEARKSGFCRAEVAGKPVDCGLGGGDEESVTVELPAESASDGAVVRLARARFDAVFPVPAAAVVRAGDTDRLWIATPAGRAELRAIAVAERSGDEALVSQGLDVGDQVILGPPPGLTSGSRVAATPAR